MTESLANNPGTGTPSTLPTEETLRLKCDQCGGGLVMRRRHLGVKGQCVHCRVPLMAVEEGGVVRVVSERPAAAATTLEPAVSGGPAPAGETDLSQWNLANFETPRSSGEEAPAPEAGATGNLPKMANSPIVPELQPPLPTRDSDNLFGGKPAEILPPDPAMSAAPERSPFAGNGGGFSLSLPSFLGSEEETGVKSSWGTQVPKEEHASISPFGTGTAGGGFAESLFREKVEKENAAHHTVAAGAFSPVSGDESTAPKRDCEERVILDGDGRPMRPMTKEEEAEFADNFFKYENARSASRWGKRIRTMAIRMLVTFCLLGAAGGGVAAFAPKEKLVEWKAKAIEWLEPGMAILDYLPEKWRPDWLPRSSFGIDGGKGGEGQPKKKLNAFEGLEKLKGDVGNMRGNAEEELKKLNQM